MIELQRHFFAYNWFAVKGNTKASMFGYGKISGFVANAGSGGKVNIMQLVIICKLGNFGLAVQNEVIGLTLFYII